MTKMIAVVIRFTPETYNRLNKLANGTNGFLAGIVRDCVQEALPSREANLSYTRYETPLGLDAARNKLLALVQEHAPVTRRWLSRQFSSRDKAAFNEALGQMFFNGQVVKTGLGRRGSPELISKGLDI